MKTLQIIFSSLLLTGCAFYIVEGNDSDSETGDTLEIINNFDSSSSDTSSGEESGNDTISSSTEETGDGDGDSTSGDGDGDGDPGDGDGDPNCGNGVLDLNEQCDGLLGIELLTCSDFGYDEGVLFCDGSCKIDLSDCSYFCGNGVWNPGEECDTNDFHGKSCVDYGFNNGVLDCNDNCFIDSSNCSGACQGIFQPCDLLDDNCCDGFMCALAYCVPN